MVVMVQDKAAPFHGPVGLYAKATGNSAAATSRDLSTDLIVIHES